MYPTQIVAICCKNKKRDDKVKAFATRPGTISSQPPTYRTFQARKYMELKMILQLYYNF